MIAGAALVLPVVLSCSDAQIDSPPVVQPSASEPESASPSPSEISPPTPIETSPSPDDRILTVGDEGPRVRKLHDRLDRLGYEDVPDGSRYSDRTRAAVASFQEEVGIPSDGGFGPEERSALKEALSELRAERREPDDDESSEEQTAVLEEGDAGDEVVEVQRRLDSLRYWVGPQDGVYGTLTEQAVLAFQGVEGLTRDGIVGPETKRALQNASTPQPHSDSGDLIEIDEISQVIYVIRDGAVRWTFHTSTGTEEPYQHPDGVTYLADTPNGRWTFSWQVDGWRDGRLGRMWRPKYFHDDGIAIHGYPSVPSYPASHGCARVTIEAMDFIWENGLAPMGSRVLVYGRG